MTAQRPLNGRCKGCDKSIQEPEPEDIRQSVEEYKKEIAKAQIVMFPGGFSAGDEPEGSAKFFATVFRNAVIKEEVEKLLNERDGLDAGYLQRLPGAH